MKCLFVGGPLDGELREVPEGKWHVDAYEYHGLDEPREITRYAIANGIARHESVSEEEVARRVHLWMGTYRCEPLSQADCSARPNY